ncbi:hypothetical protein STEG23_032632, partial [Scotinomys teguina]
DKLLQNCGIILSINPLDTNVDNQVCEELCLGFDGDCIEFVDCFWRATVYVGEDVEQEEHSSIDGESANWYSYFGNQYGGFMANWESIYLKTQLYHA